MFCKNCGAKNRDDAKFCAACGSPLSSLPEAAAASPEGEKAAEDRVEPSEEVILADVQDQLPAEQISRAETRPSKTSWLHRKWLTIPLAVLVIVIVGLYFAGRYVTDPVHTVDAFEQAVHDHNVGHLKGMIHTYEDTEVTDNQVKAMLQWFKEDPDAYSDIVKSLEKSAQSEKHARVGDTLYYLQKSGKKYFIYDNYQITTETIHPKVTTNLKNMVVGITGVGKSKSATKATSNSPQTLVLDGVIPGIYTFYGHSDKMDTSQKKSLNEANVQVDFSGIYISLSSNVDGAELYVNDQDTGKTIAQAGEWGPFKKDDTPTFYAKYTVNGRSIQSEKVSVSSEGDYDSPTLEDAESNGIELNFEDIDTGDFYSLDSEDSQENMDTLHTYFDGFYSALSSAVSYDEPDDFASYFETGSDYANSQLKMAKKFYDDGVEESINSYDINSVKKTGNGLFSVETYETWDQSVTDDETGEVTDKGFSYKNTYQLKETAPGELKIVGQKITDRKEQESIQE